MRPRLDVGNITCVILLQIIKSGPIHCSIINESDDRRCIEKSVSILRLGITVVHSI